MWEVQESDDVLVATMEVNGSVREIQIGSNLREVVIQTARDAGFGKFRFYIDEEEVLPQNAPILIESKAYRVAPYDVAGNLV